MTNYCNTILSQRRHYGDSPSKKTFSHKNLTQGEQTSLLFTTFVKFYPTDKYRSQQN